MPLSARKQKISDRENKRTDERDEALNTPVDHIGSSEAFLKTESTGSADADNLSDEKLDELLDEKED